MKGRMRVSRGFSIVEVLIGITILIVGFIPVYLLIFSSEKGSAETIRGVQAMMHAHTLLEEVAHLPYAMIQAAPRSADTDYLDRFSKSKETEGYFARTSDELKSFFDRSIEVIEGEGWKRIKVYVIDKHLSGSTGGKRGELLLETLVVR